MHERHLGRHSFLNAASLVSGQAVRLLRTVSGLSTRPQDYVTSLGPCFATDNVDVIVAAMDTLSTVDCDMQVNMYARRNQTFKPSRTLYL